MNSLESVRLVPLVLQAVALRSTTRDPFLTATWTCRVLLFFTWAEQIVKASNKRLTLPTKRRACFKASIGEFKVELDDSVALLKVRSSWSVSCLCLIRVLCVV